MMLFPRSPVWNVIQESVKIPTSSDHISINIVRTTFKFGPKVQCDLFSNGFVFGTSKTSQKKIDSENSTIPVWSSKTLEPKALIPNVMKPAQEKIEKIDQRLKIQPLRGGNLLYIT